MKKYPLPIAYVVLLTLCVPINILFLCLCFMVLSHVSSDFSFSVYCLLTAFYWAGIVILGIKNISKSFSLFRQRDAVSCVNGMLILKYGMVIFFFINFVVITFLMLAGILGAFIGSRGTIIFAFPIALPMFFLIVLASMFFTWLLLIPGAFYGIQVIRLAYGEGKTKLFTGILHGLLQFTFFADVLDAMYLAVGKYQMGKKSSMVIAGLYLILAAGMVYLGVKIYGLL